MDSSNDYNRDRELSRYNGIQIHMARLKLKGEKCIVAEDGLNPEGYVWFDGVQISAIGKYNKCYALKCIEKNKTIENNMEDYILN